MQPLTAASRDVPPRDQYRRFSRIARRERVGKPAANTTFARLANRFTLALAMILGISAAPGSGSANENPIDASDIPLILADATDIQTVDPDPSRDFMARPIDSWG